METISKLPDSGFIIGAKEIKRGVDSGKIKQVIVAKNCPKFLLDKFDKKILKQFDGNQKELGTKLGKPFAVAMVGY